MRKTYTLFLSLFLCIAIVCSLQDKLETPESGSINRTFFVEKFKINYISYKNKVEPCRHFLQVAMKHKAEAAQRYNEMKIDRLENSLLNHLIFTNDLHIVMKKIIFYDKQTKLFSLYTNA